jgi:hypothetical protein
MKIRKFLPIENIVYKTSLTKDEVIKRLSESIEPECGQYSPYEGTIFEQIFEIRKVIRFGTSLKNQYQYYLRNPFLPLMINGVITNDCDGLIIKVKIEPEFPITLLLCILCGGMGLSGIGSLIDGLDNIITLFFLGLSLLIYAVVIGGFKLESSYSKRDFKRIFQAEITEE